ncbi:hypothetical protein SSBR45G_46600 [Bradyrhizobium sp. SSBR45G]|uniref:hypothetical protein n=1 Tax=unclassified Bradyrhizobium TaxID=2631580 RepID=UPI0023428F2C|nr:MULTISPECIES: hypothetical protein [unclassified Bradyrhizobium]GLH79751.1 hypothetical protein SSBR45G_46600 [Bradyrhizobium sp. SSBR45G]GLH87131.1 hypothetical protein SSBR45R_45910 [Bradyrhizobium sp. SSBR45R]
MKVIMLQQWDAWVIRLERPGRQTVFYETEAVWNVAAARATIFRDYEAAHAGTARMRRRIAQDGEILDVVPLAGAILAAALSDQSAIIGIDAGARRRPAVGCLWRGCAPVGDRPREGGGAFEDHIDRRLMGS